MNDRGIVAAGVQADRILCGVTPTVQASVPRRAQIQNGLLDGVNVASLGLMAAVTWQLGRASLTGPLTILIALSSFVLLIWFKVNSTWLIAGGGLIGLLSSVLR